MTRTEDIAMAALGRRLYEIMERLEPSPVTILWEDLPDHEKDFYVECVGALIESSEWVSTELATGQRR